jgi:hypothetical protein
LLQEDFERALPFLPAVFANQIEVTPIGGGFGEELGWVFESLTVKELVFH